MTTWRVQDVMTTEVITAPEDAPVADPIEHIRAIYYYQAITQDFGDIGYQLLIDEAGMADTLTLDTAIRYTLHHGGRVCLVGDDQQLAAIGAGGIITDLQRTYGAVQLTQLHRFADRATAVRSVDRSAGEHLLGLARELLERRPEPGPVSLVHGDCKPSQFLLADDLVAVLDLDHCGIADPAYDVGNFVASLRQGAVRAGAGGARR